MEIISNFDQSFYSEISCPACNEKLKRYGLIDPYLQGLICKNGHRYYVPLKQRGDVKTDLPAVKADTDSEVILAWLTNDVYRNNLLPQLAVIIRRIYEIHENNVHINEVPLNISFKYCLFCKEVLRPFTTKDNHSQGLRCNNGHQFAYGHFLYIPYKGKHIELYEEMSDKTVVFLAKGYVNENKKIITQAFLHPQIKEIFTRFLKKYEPK